MKKKLKICTTSPTADYALTSDYVLRLFSLEGNHIYGTIGCTTTILTGVIVSIPKGYIGILCTSPKLLADGAQLVGGIQILDNFTNDGVWEIRPSFIQSSRTTTLLTYPKHTHIATLYLIKQKKIKV